MTFFLFGSLSLSLSLTLSHTHTHNTHSLGHPKQLGHHPNTDQPSDADLIEVEVRAGVFIVMGTDGLFDNLGASAIYTYLSIYRERECEREREKERDTDRHRHRQRHRETETKRDRDRDRKKERASERASEREREKESTTPSPQAAAVPAKLDPLDTSHCALPRTHLGESIYIYIYMSE